MEIYYDEAGLLKEVILNEDELCDKCKMPIGIYDEDAAYVENKSSKGKVIFIVSANPKKGICPICSEHKPSKNLDCAYDCDI